MSAYTEFFLSGSRNSVQLELLEISHPNFSTVYRRVRNARKGVTVTVEDLTEKTFDYLPMSIKNLGSRDDLDNGISVTFSDLGKIVPKEIQRIQADNGFAVKPTAKFYVYDSSDLSQPLYGPLHYSIKTFTFNREGVTFEAKAPELNYSATGMLYRIDAFPMLRGAL